MYIKYKSNIRTILINTDHIYKYIVEPNKILILNVGEEESYSINFETEENLIKAFQEIQYRLNTNSNQNQIIDISNLQ